MADFDTQINVGMNVDGVVSGTEKAKRSVRDLGESARGAGKSLGGIGDGAGQSAQKVESATKSMIQSIQRTTAATEAGDKSTRAYQESLARLRGIDVAALKPYLDQLDQAKNKADAAARSADSLSKSLNNIKVASAIVAAAGAAFVAYAKGINNGVDALNDLKDATGASIENISALEDIALRTGTSFDTVGTSLIKLNQALNTAKPGSDTERAIKAIGLSVADLKALDPAEAFQKIAVSLSGYSDDANKARLTQELFGKSLKEIAPLLKDAAEAGKLVGTVTTAQAEAAEKLNKQIFSLQKNATDLSRAFVSTLVPAISEGADRFMIAYKNAGSLLGVLALYARLDYSKGIQGNLAQIEGQIKSLEERATRITSESVLKGNDKQIADLKAQAQYLKEIRQQKILIAQGDNSDAVSRKFLDKKTSVGDIGSGPDKAALAAAKAARAQAIKDEIEGFKTMDEARKEYEKAMAEGLKGEIAAYNEYAKAQESAQQKVLDGYQKAADSATQRASGLADEESAAALAAASNVSLAVAVEQLGLARAREAQAKALSAGADGATLLALQQEIEAREKIIGLLGNKESRESAADAAKNAASEWKKAAEQIEQSITDALFRGFESGKGFIENLRDTIVNAFKTMVLRPIVSAVVNPFAGAIAGALGYSGAASAAGTAGGAASGLAAGSVLGSAAAFASGIGTSLASGFAATIAGSTSSAISVGLSTIASGTAASVASGVSTIVGALGPYALAAVGIVAVLNALKGGEYVQSLGESVARVTADKLVQLSGSGGTNDVSIGGGLNIRQTESSDKFANGLASAFVAAASKFGISSAGASFGFGSNNSDGGKFGLTASVGGQTYKTGDIKTSEAALQLEASRAVFFALQSSELPGYLSKVFDGITASTAAQADIDAALNYAGGLKQIRDALTETREPLQILKDTVAASFAALGTSADTFKTDFVAAIDAGISPDKLAQFQQLGANLEALAQSSSTAAGAVRSLTDIANERKSLDERFAQATLTEVQLLERTRNALDESNRARFDEVIAAEKAKDAFANNAAEILRVAGTLASQQTKNPLLNTDPASISANAIKLGLTEGALFETLNKIAADEKAAAEARFAQKRQENYAAAAEAFARQTRGTVAVGSVTFGQQSAGAGDSKALQDQLDELQLSTVEKAAKARAALDSESRGIFDQLEKAKGVKTAAEEAAKALEKFTGAMRGLTDTNADLQIKLLEAQGNTTGAQAATRSRDIARLTDGFGSDEAARLTAQYDANESLKAQIEALTKSQQDAASAASTLKSAWASVTDSLLDQVDRIRGKLAADSLDSIGAQQARFTIATAQARAGDLDAAKRLGSYGDALIGSVTADATNRLERIKIQAQVAESLQTTASLLGGTPTPVLSAQFPQQQSTVQLEQNIASLTAQVALLKGHLAEIQTQAKRTADAVNGAGEAPMVVEVD